MKILLPLSVIFFLSACAYDNAPSTTTNAAISTTKHNATLKEYKKGDCSTTQYEGCTPDQWIIYYSDSTAENVSEETYDNAALPMRIPKIEVKVKLLSKGYVPATNTYILFYDNGSRSIVTKNVFENTEIGSEQK